MDSSKSWTSGSQVRTAHRGLSATRNLTAWQTQPGVVLGTLQYMSPEQASTGQPDFRSDQFSFGLVLYEMLTGKHPFKRKTAVETMVAILREQAEPIGAHNLDVPAPLCWAIERCLAKEPDKRYVSTRDLARELAAIRDRFSEKPVQRRRRAHQYSVQRTRFVGREKEVAGAKELLLRQDVRLVTVTGPGGIGKTRLAIEVASGLAELFPGGAHYIPLSPLSDSGLIPFVIVQTLGIGEAGGQSPLEVLRKYLQDSLRVPMLFLMDNFEHLIPAAPTVAELLGHRSKSQNLGNQPRRAARLRGTGISGAAARPARFAVAVLRRQRCPKTQP